ncbi:metallophosphoesterase [Arthrobacter sp. AET 35A]|uniref:metallophosphoesterase n=1 Tax=Arthrobacter sp. AET 35A TaxID=2292643 RepID=UPI00177DFA83|nr:metallophosphoesterase [Arthrobacter sp. AET 35A]MBE0011379.1 metallophosphoesterase [Arthrobacter sp. AET 35A]
MGSSKLLDATTIALGGTAALAVAGLGYASLVERNLFQLREETLPILPPGSRPVRILHLSDIHMAPHQAAKTQWLQELARLKPDLVVNTGDNLSHRKGVEPLLEALGPLLQFPGVFVPGSNDYYAPVLNNPLRYFSGPSKHRSDREPKALPWAEMFRSFGAAGWIDLSNRSQSIAMGNLRLDFTGVDDPHINRDSYAGYPAGSSTSSNAPHLRIAVAHAPYQRVLDYFTADGAHLILAGHTHGGQVCIPGYGALVSNCDLPTWRARGLTDWEHEGRTIPLNVSAGIGTSRFAPVRFACRPEAVLLTLSSR